MEEDKYIKESEIPGVYFIERPTFEDSRGFFRETFRMTDMEAILGKPFEIKQENHSRSTQGVLRGIHIAPWSKLIDIKKGEAQQIIIDLRKNSPTFKKYISLHIGESNRVKIYLPAFCGNAYLVLSDEADYGYLTDQYWEPGKEKGVIWNDPELKLPWETENPILSDKDQQNPTLQEYLKNLNN